MLSSLVFTLADFSEIIAAVLFGGGILWAAFEWRGGKIFVTKDAVVSLRQDMDERLDELQEQGQRRGEKLEALKAEVERLPDFREVQEVKSRTAILESRLAELPDKDSLHKLEVKLESQGGDLKAVKTSLEALTASNRRIEEHLMNSRGK